jgi:hypothetical protein
MELTGGCMCKAVRYRATEAPILARTCWCRACQYIGAGSSTVNAMFKTSSLTVEGELREYRGVADSGNVMQWRFCPQCGTHVLATSERRPHLTAVRIGTLDDPEQVRPAATIWTSMAPSWAPIDPSLPRVEQQPPPPVVPPGG